MTMADLAALIVILAVLTVIGYRALGYRRKVEDEMARPFLDGRSR